jgi:hypothetical protein
MNFNTGNIGRVIRYISMEMKYGLMLTVQEILMRRFISPLVSNIHQLEKKPKLFDKLLSLIESNYSFLVIMLLSARFEIFQNVAKYIEMQGELEKVVAPNEYSYIWIPRLFSRYHEIKIFYPYLKVGVHDTSKVFGSLKNTILIKDKYFFNSTPPDSINKYVFKHGFAKRNVIVYSQPHFPWFSDFQLSQQLYHYVSINELMPGDIVHNAMKKLKISRKRILRAYYLDLVIVLRSINELIKYVKTRFNFDKIVITGIHGEILGEYNFYFHKNFKIPQLVVVPWYEVTI